MGCRFSIMNRRPTLKEILIAFIALLLSITVLILLLIWTQEIDRENRMEDLRRALHEAVEDGGERAVMEAAGIPVSDIRYSYEDIPLFRGEKGAWKLSEEDRRGISLYQNAAPCVVAVSSSSSSRSAVEDGAGVILSSEGFIVTNNHVIGSGESYKVRFLDGSESEASLIGRDPVSDLAVIKVDRSDLEAIAVGSVHSVSVGENVYAIGHPYGFEWSLSRGIVSGLGRRIRGRDGNTVIPGMIQTDALINPGNSGGPLLSADGRMIGIISSIYSESGGGEGIAFAIPAETVLDVSGTIISAGKVERGWLDLLSVELNPVIAEYASLPIDKGILISETVPGGKSAAAGLKGGSAATQYGQSVIYIGGDVITALDGERIEDYDDYFAFFFSSHPGDKVDVTVLRDGTEMTIEDVELIKQDEGNIRWIAR